MSKKPKVGMWSGLTAVTAVLTAGAIVGTTVAFHYTTTVNNYLDADTYKIIKGDSDEDTEYFKSDFTSDEERESYEAELCAQVEAEGAALLKNDNNALPLASGAKVSLFGHGSVDLMYGGTGSGSVDTSKAPNFKQALEDQGIQVNSTLWDLYSSDDMMKNYSRITPAAISDTLEANTQYAVNEAPWSKLSSAESNTTVLCMLYGCMMGNYDGLYLPMMVLGYVFSVPFFLLTVRTSQKKGQKASLMRYVSVALICYIGVLVLLLLWGKGDAFTLSLMSDGKVSINVYTILFIALFGIGYGAYYATADMPIPMVADCSDYETYISGKYIPGIMGTLFSLVDKLVSSLSATVVGVAVSFIGLDSLPTQYDPYTPGMNVVVIVLFCVIPMIAWTATLLAMKNYSLTGEKMKEIQAVNACRRDAVADGMSLEDAMQKWQTIDQLPAQYRAN